MVRTIEGTYRDGKVELSETPADVQESRVLVIFWPGEVDASEREAVLARVLERAEEGFDLGGPPYPKREELYDRVNRWLRKVE
jgi:hypothetical protein